MFGDLGDRRAPDHLPKPCLLLLFGKFDFSHGYHSKLDGCRLSDVSNSSRSRFGGERHPLKIMTARLSLFFTQSNRRIVQHKYLISYVYTRITPGELHERLSAFFTELVRRERPQIVDTFHGHEKTVPYQGAMEYRARCIAGGIDCAVLYTGSQMLCFIC